MLVITFILSVLYSGKLSREKRARASGRERQRGLCLAMRNSSVTATIITILCTCIVVYVWFSKHALQRVNSVHDQPGYPLFTDDSYGRKWEILLIYNLNTLGVSLSYLGTATAVSMLIGSVYVLMIKPDSILFILYYI